MNRDQFEGNWKQFKGDQKRWGKFTDDDMLVIEGHYEKFEGSAEAVWKEKGRGEALDGQLVQDARDQIAGIFETITKGGPQ